MLRLPKLLDPGATVGEVRALLADDHVHLVLLVDAGVIDGRLRGTLARSDLPSAAADADGALAFARIEGRTTAPDLPLAEVRARMVATRARRLVVVDDGGRVRGLLCLKWHGRGFCADADVRAREAERQVGTNEDRSGTKVPDAEGAHEAKVDQATKVRQGGEQTCQVR